MTSAIPVPRLIPALVGMTALQGIVALGLFAPGIVAPAYGFDAVALALFSSAVFAVGIVGALVSGQLVARLGPFGVAAVCAISIAAAMLVAMQGSTAALLVAGLLVGVAFGPETPASSALLGQLARPGQRPFVFSVRQTGNQIGAIIGSLTLPALAMHAAALPFAAVSAAALTACLVFVWLRPHYQGGALATPLSLGAGLRLLRDDADIRRLALASAPMSAMQLGLNAFLVTYLVIGLRLDHLLAGVVLGVAQAGGLVGRLGWGVVATGLGGSRPLIALLALAMAGAGGAVAALPLEPPLWVLLPLAFLFGLTASGWNGIFLAEVARTAPVGRVAEATGSVLVASYAGLLAAPLMISVAASIGGMRLAYLVLAAGALGSALIIGKAK